MFSRKYESGHLVGEFRRALLDAMALLAFTPKLSLVGIVLAMTFEAACLSNLELPRRSSLGCLFGMALRTLEFGMQTLDRKARLPFVVKRDLGELHFDRMTSVALVPELAIMPVLVAILAQHLSGAIVPSFVTLATALLGVEANERET